MTFEIFKLHDIHTRIRLRDTTSYVSLYHIGECFLAYGSEEFIIFMLTYKLTFYTKCVGME